MKPYLITGKYIHPTWIDLDHISMIYDPLALDISRQHAHLMAFAIKLAFQSDNVQILSSYVSDTSESSAEEHYDDLCQVHSNLVNAWKDKDIPTAQLHDRPVGWLTGGGQ